MRLNKHAPPRYPLPRALAALDCTGRGLSPHKHSPSQRAGPPALITPEGVSDGGGEGDPRSYKSFLGGEYCFFPVGWWLCLGESLLASGVTLAWVGCPAVVFSSRRRRISVSRCSSATSISRVGLETFVRAPGMLYDFDGRQPSQVVKWAPWQYWWCPHACACLSGGGGLRAGVGVRRLVRSDERLTSP